MVLIGAFLNGLFIIIGSVIGLFFRNIHNKTKETVLIVIGLTVAVLGIQLSITSTNFIIIVISLVVGTIIGEWLNIEGWLEKVGYKVESLFRKQNTTGKIAEGFITASLIFVIGSMAVVGAIDSGVKNDHTILITKGIIDGFMSIFLTSTLGIGVILSAIPVFLYEGIIALSATTIEHIVPKEVFTQFIQEMSATGGIMILAIGLNVAKITSIRVANLLPSLIVVGVVVFLMQMI